MQRAVSVVAVALVALASDAGTMAAGAEGPDAETLVGAWELVSIETVRPDGGVIHPFYGAHPRGLLVYDRAGWMSVQIASDPLPTRPRAGSREAFAAAPMAEKAEAIDGYYAYFGTWSLDAGARTVTHHIAQSLYPAERGDDAVRHYRLDGDGLELVARTHEMGEDHVRRLLWTRLRSRPRR